jgi:acyl transferase domain-containing protein/surfactin synthase thioesterase subunit
MNPIAIIGIGCRFPQAKEPQSFWQLLRKGIDPITEVPANRWPVEQFYHPEPATPGRMNTRWGGFIENVEGFDAEFFQITAREAEKLDPQHRLLLEVTWEALENAQIIPSHLAGSATGVFIGISSADYLLLSGSDVANINAYYVLGNTFSTSANRISYLFDFKGPSMAIDTACSSSLVALHQACQSLAAEEINLGLVGGVNLILSPNPTINFSQARMMAADGRCKTFDERADGYVRSEGCGIIVLKRLEDALRDGDRIYATIKGSAVNQDGLTNGMTAPNGLSQQAVIRQALKKAGVSPAQISYIETHGTGTALGDPIEVKALKSVLLENRPPDSTCWLGSVKANIGHLEAAAGIAGLIKVALSLQHRQIPPQLHLQKLNPYISLEGTPLKIPTELEDWTVKDRPRLAGISSFGFGGTNCHVILEEAPKTSTPSESAPVSWQILPLSAKKATALTDLAQSYLNYLAIHPQVSLTHLCGTVQNSRSHFDHRLGIVAASRENLQEQLQAYIEENLQNSQSSQVKLKKNPKIAFLCTGQGSQYVGMGQQLYDTEPVFREALNQCNEILADFLENSLLTILFSPSASEDSPLDRTAYTQPALFALEYALAQLWQSWGIKPALVMGHSVGEYVAACLAGVFSLEDGLKLIAHRGRLMQSLPPDGAMAVVRASLTQVQSMIDQETSGQENPPISIAAINGSENIVISGDRELVFQLSQKFEYQGIQTTPLRVSHAFHSPLMEPIIEEFKAIAESITYHTPQIPLISNLTGQLITKEIATPDYWCAHILAPVRFAESVDTLASMKIAIFLEIGAKPTLLGMGRQNLDREDIAWLPSLRADKDDRQQILASLASLYERGVAINWSQVNPHNNKNLDLPTYPFQRQRYWFKEAEESPIIPDLVKNFPVLPPEITPQEILSLPESAREARLQTYLGKLLQKVTRNPLNYFDEQQKLVYLGLDSLMAVEIRKQLETDLKITVPVEYFAELTIAQFRQQVLLLVQGQESPPAITSEATETLTSAWLPFNSGQSSAAARLFCFPHAGAGASVYQAWPSLFPPDIEICPIQLPGRETRLQETAFTRLQPLIVSLTEAIADYLDRPFAFFGHSFGALLSFELTRYLRRQGLPQPCHLFLSARRAPQLPDFETPIHNLPEDRFIEALKPWGGIPSEVLQTPEFSQLYLPPLRADFALLETYFYAKDKPVDCPIYGFGGQEDSTVNQRELEAWQEQTNQKMNLKLFSGDHFFLEKNLREISKIITNQFNSVRSN